MSRPLSRPSTGYGVTLDGAASAPVPAPGRPPIALPVRPQATPVTVAASSAAATRTESGAWLLAHCGDSVTLTGRGYVQVRWDVRYQDGVGVLRLPVWTGLEGKLFHVASGGGHRLDDAVPGMTDRPHTWLGRPSTGYDTLPADAQQPWRAEFYYLDGTVTLHSLQGEAPYRLAVAATDRATIVADLGQTPGGATGLVRYGIVRDIGTDLAPIPQYLTRRDLSALADLLAVPQLSVV